MAFEQLKSFKIAPALRRKIDMDPEKDPEKPYDIIICKRDDVRIEALVEELGRHNIVVDPSKEATDHYVFKKLKWAEIETIARLQEVDQIWPDEEGYALLNESVETSKAKAVLNTYGKFGKDICWALLDTGINRNHPHFQALTYKYLNFPEEGTVIHWENFTDDKETDPDFYGKSGHGTHVASIIAGKSTGKV